MTTLEKSSQVVFQSSFPRSFLYRVFSARSDLFFQAAGPLSSKQPTRANHAFFSDKIKKKQNKLLLFPCKLFFLYIGQEPVTCAATNCLQIKVCSCVVSFSSPEPGYKLSRVALETRMVQCRPTVFGCTAHA